MRSRVWTNSPSCTLVGGGGSLVGREPPPNGVEGKSLYTTSLVFRFLFST